MTISTHEYSATLLLGGPDEMLPLSIKDGTVSVDVARFNHVEASLTVPVTDSSKLANFDPRRKLRVRIDADATFPAFSQSRSFDLALRSARPNRATGDVDLRLASDESILQDFGPLANDSGARAHASSIRGLTNYALGKIGATLQAGGEDANVTPYWSASNLIPDPRYTRIDASQWSQANLTTVADGTFPGSIHGVAHTGVHLAQPSSTDSYVNVGPTAGMAFSTRVGKTYVFSATGSVRAVITGTGPSETDAATGTVLPRQRALVVHATGPGFSPAYKVWHSAQVPNVAETGTSAGTRVAVKFTVPPDTLHVFFRVYHGGTGGSITWSQFSLQEVDADYPVEDGAQYFFGSKPDTANYEYSWRGIADGSPTERRAVVERPRDLFTWRAGVGGIDFLSPILQSQGFRLVCDEERRWTLRRDGYRASGNLNLAYAVNVIGADEEITRESQDWFDAATYSYRWRAADGTEKSADDTYALPGYTKHVRRQIDREYPGPGRAQYAVQRAHNRGRTLAVETVANWDAKADQEVLVRLDGTPIQLGTADSIEWNLSTDRMRVTSRTADTPEGAIDLLPGTINSLPGSINSLT
ncbi:hypothetical protein [Microbacterium sp. Ag1]|uniref:hypothetical protein n=1 Tax=Microbacterium sp. Ag1 TaxID=1643443 RepID=UPI000629C55F|nr:hypothetical protein [Microbacterium sp. Ag1]KKX97186.1 hypothetical protein AAY78_14510 [Microbacterium sp. Ag1]